MFFFRFTAHRGLGFYTLFILYYSVVCRPSDGPRFELGTGDPEADTTTPPIQYFRCFWYGAFQV